MKGIVNKEAITVVEAGRRGRHATLASHGKGFFKKISRKGGQRTAELYRGLLREFGKKGGRPRKQVLNEYMGERDRQKRR